LRNSLRKDVIKSELITYFLEITIEVLSMLGTAQALPTGTNNSADLKFLLLSVNFKNFREKPTFEDFAAKIKLKNAEISSSESSTSV